MFTKKDFLADAKKIDAMPNTRLVYTISDTQEFYSWGSFRNTQNDYKDLEKLFPSGHYLEVFDNLETITEKVRNSNYAMEQSRIEAERLRIVPDYMSGWLHQGIWAGAVYPPKRMKYIFSILIPDDKRITAKKPDIWDRDYTRELVPASHILTVRHVFDCNFKFVHYIGKPHFQLGFEQSFLPYAKMWESKMGTVAEKTMAVLNHYTNYFKFFSRNYFSRANKLIEQIQNNPHRSANTLFKNLDSIFRDGGHRFIKEFGYEREKYYQGDFGIMHSFLCCALDHARQNEFLDMLSAIFINRPLSLLVFDYLNNFECCDTWRDLDYQNSIF